MATPPTIGNKLKNTNNDGLLFKNTEDNMTEKNGSKAYIHTINQL